MKKYLRIICFFFPVFTISQTDNYRFEHYSVEQGLSQTTIYSIFQDSRGFMWFGTADGLNRYDGYKFVTYRNNPDDSSSISSNRIYSIIEDTTGNLWIGTNGGGLNKFIRAKDHFISFQHNPKDNNSPSSNKIFKIFFDRQGILWLGTDGGGLNRLDTGKKTFTRYQNNPEENTSLSNNVVRTVYQDGLGKLWIGTADGLNMFIEQENNFIVYKHNPDDKKSLSDNEVLCIYEDSSEQLWIGTGNGGLNRFNRKNNSFDHYKFIPGDKSTINANRVFTITEDRSGNLWIGTMGGGLNKFNKTLNRFNYFSQDPGNLFSINDNFIFSLYVDQTEVLWIGTYKGGINKLDKSKKRFAHFSHQPDFSNSLSNNGVYTFCEDADGDIWIGTGNGLNKFERKKKSFQNYFNKPGVTNSVASNEVIVVYQDRSMNIWIGTYGGGLNLFDKHNNRFTNFKNNPDDSFSISSNKIFSILEDKDGYLWIGTDGDGLNKFDRKKNQFIRYKFNASDNTTIRSNKIYTIYEDKSGDLWFGTDGGGLNKYVKEEDRFICFLHDLDNPGSISNNSIFAIHEDQEGNLWLGTYGGGLNKFDRSSNKFIHFRKQHGLPNDVVYGILEDGNQNLWLSTNQGIAVLNPRTEKIKSYDIRDGIQSNEFNQGAYLKTRDGSMFFGGINGFNLFHPDSLKENTIAPNVAITDFQIFYKSVMQEHNNSTVNSKLSRYITEAKEINLTYEDKVISFEFSALDFQTPSKNKYAYIMEGFDNDWNYTDADRRFVTYTNLDPGDYVFRVKGSNNDGVWTEEGTSINIYISPPWWATWWAYCFYGFVFIVGLLAIRTYDLKRQRLKHQLKLEHEQAIKLQEIDQIKSRFFANISHEFRTPLTLIIGPVEKILSGIPLPDIIKQAEMVKMNAKRLLGLIAQLLDLSKLDEGKLKLKVSGNNLVSFVKGIVMSFESLSEQKDIKLKVNSEKENINVYFDKEKLEKCLINILANSFKFTNEGGSISISLFEKNETLAVIKIRDSGIGISERELPKLFDRFYQVDSSHTREKGGTGIGLSLTKELIELHHGRVSVESVEGQWTEFTIELRLGKDHFDAEEFDYEDSGSEIRKPELENVYYELNRSSEISEPGFVSKDDEKTIVLVVEDNSDVRGFIKDSLGMEYHIEEASNGEQGIRKAQSIIPDLIISDIMMPQMDGNELTRIIKNDERTSHIPVILLTAKSDQKSKIEGLETGADDYLVKPFDTKELLVRIKNLISIRQKLQEKYSKGNFVPEIKAEGKKLSVLDEKFMNKVSQVIELHLSEEAFSIEQFGREAGMSRTQLHRKIKALTGKSASTFLRSFRLNKAKEMIERKEETISEIAYKVGFSSPAYFSRCFKEEFGYSPSDLIS